MDIGSIFLILAVIILVGLFVSRPFFERETAQSAPGSFAEQGEHDRSRYLAERDRVLSALAELDSDNQLGKIPAEEYPVQRAALVARGAEALRRLDELQASAPVQPGPSHLESAAPVTNAPEPDDELEELINARRRARSENAAGFCPKCGKPIQKSDRFCPRCGAAI